MTEPGIQLEAEGAKEEAGHWKLEAGPAYHTSGCRSRLLALPQHLCAEP